MTLHWYARLAACGVLCVGTSALAQVQEVPQPSEITGVGQALAAGARSAPEGFAAAPEAAVRARRLDPGAEFDIQLLSSRIWNPNEGRFDNVEHRGYVDRRNPTPAGNLYQAPLVEAKPGDTVRINFRNLLPPEPGCAHMPETMNAPDDKLCYNDTNNHFHGGWVNPDGISDNVLRVLPPNPDHLYEYEYNIPREHPAGTFWYHPHVHGSTAIQVGSGMAGPLIIRGNRWPEVTADGGFAPGDVDVLLRRGHGRAIPDKVFLLQQIQYACRVRADGTPKPPAEIWTCAADEVGKLDSYTLFLNPGPQWDASGRFTTVNGRVAAPLAEHAVAGRPERWRFIHGGISDTIQVQIFRRAEPEVAEAGQPTLFERTAAADQDAVIREACAVDEGAIEMFEVAADGLTRPSLLATTSRFLQPGYRSDVLVAFQEPGEYCVIDGAVTPNQGIPGSLDTQRLLFTVKVDPPARGNSAPAPRDAIVGMLRAAVQNGPLTGALKQQVLAEVGDGELGFFTPHASLQGEPIDNVQNVRFALTTGLQSDAPSVAPGLGIGYRRTAPGAAVPNFGVLRYSDNPLDTIVLTVGDTDEWRLTAVEPVGHPFHIHVNPFEIIAANKRVTLPDGTQATIDLTAENEVGANGVEIPSEYLGMKGVFKDTIFVAPNVQIVARSHYRRYTGTFVIHCHILYHEDFGMMRKVTIVDPGRGTALVREAAHHR